MRKQEISREKQRKTEHAPLQIKNCEKARKYFQKMSFDLTEQEYFEMAMKVIELSKTLPEDFSKRVFRDVVLDEGLLDAVLSATRNPTLQAEAKELLWFVAEAAPLYYWTNEDSSHFLDCWNFNLVRTSEGFERLLDKGKRELFHKNFKYIRIAFGTKSEYCDSDEKKEMSKKFKSCDIGKTGDFERTMNILFPSKYTTGNYYIYIPKV